MPNLSRLAREGVRAEAMVPVFPTKTFPNHYTIVTGKYPARHGIVSNVLTAPDIGRRLSLFDREAVRDASFYLAEPIWVTAERPVFLTLYFGLVDNAGHEYGPDAPATDTAIVAADRLIGRVMAGLERIGRGDVNVLVVSDHGMASTGPERAIWLDEYLAKDAMEVDEMNTILTAWPAPALEDSVHRALERAPHITVYRRGEPTKRYRLEGPRIAPIVAVADEGWTISRRTAEDPSPTIIRGNHGYDDTLASMRAIFVARGPAFRRGLRVPAFRNAHLYPLMANVLGIQPGESDGSLDTLRAVLSAPAPVQ